MDLTTPSYDRSAAPAHQTVAAIDLGSNSFHLLVVRSHNGRFEVIEHIKEAVRLGAELDATGAIGDVAMVRGLACLERFAQRLREIDPVHVRAVGTNALRIAANAGEFLARAGDVLGMPVETVSGVEEARLIYLGVSRSLANRARRLVLDIGGGSTELIIGEGDRALRLESLPIGCVSLTQRHFPGGVIDRRRLRHAEIAARRELEPVAAGYRELGWVEVAGASGTVHAIAAVGRAMGWSDGVLSPPVLDRLVAELDAAGNLSRLRLPGLNPDQALVLPGGLAILRALFAGFGVEQMRPVEGALREGLLYDLLARTRDDDIRGRSVDELAARYRVDGRHAERVEHAALGLLRQVAHTWTLNFSEDAAWLGWAARLHEIGRAIAHSGYHRHGAYIAEHADLAGFSQQDQQHVATLVRAHRRAFPLQAFERYRVPLRERLLRLAMLLRIAVLLNRSQGGFVPEDMQVTMTARGLVLQFPPGWLAVRPLVTADLEEEADYLRAADLSLEYR